MAWIACASHPRSNSQRNHPLRWRARRARRGRPIVTSVSSVASCKNRISPEPQPSACLSLHPRSRGASPRPQVQFSTRSPGTRLNSRTLWVTSTRSKYPRGPALDDVDADVCIQEVGHPPKPSRSSCTPCSRSERKSSENCDAPAMRLSHDPCSGKSSTPFPTFRTYTRSPEKRYAFGNRTA